jgi:hypothetical protein
MRSILILEDNEERVAAFRKAISGLASDFKVVVWRDAPSMCSECERYFPTAALISLDHDLNAAPTSVTDPGTGLDVAQFLARFRPVCPIIIHTTNADRAYSMQNELRFSDWLSERVGPIGADWIETHWKKKAREFLTLGSLGTQLNKKGSRKGR